MPDQPRIIHIVEASLQDKTGHCFSHISSLVHADTAKKWRFHLWVGKDASELFTEYENVVVHPVFSPTLRRLQEFLTLAKLLRRAGQVYLPTATRTHFLLLNWAARGTVPRRKLFVYFHWLKLSPAKLRFMQKMAARYPSVQTLAPTRGVVEQLQKCGFENARVMAYPITPVAIVDHLAEDGVFKHLLFAGAARCDKGFSMVVDMVEELKKTNADIPISVQTSPSHKGSHEPAIARDIERLRNVGYPFLTDCRGTLSENEYMRLFAGAVSLQLYDPEEYAAGRISGITLDALSNGAPLLTIADTWTGDIIDQYDAGITISKGTASETLAAAKKIIDNYARYAANARSAGLALQQQNGAGKILDYLDRRTTNHEQSFI